MDIDLVAARVAALPAYLQYVLSLMARGYDNAQIARTTGLKKDSVKVEVSQIYRELGMSEVSSRTTKRALARDAYARHTAGPAAEEDASARPGGALAAAAIADAAVRHENSPPAPSDAEGLKKLNGGAGRAARGAVLADVAEIPHPPLSAAGESGGYGVASIIRVHDPATVLGVRALTLGPDAECQIGQLLAQRYRIEELVDYQSLTAPDVSITRVILVLRRG